MKKFIPPYSAQGDLNIYQVASIPLDLKHEDKRDTYILAHSETGHHHVIDGNNVRLFNVNEFTSYLEVTHESNIVHLRSFDTHDAICLPVGNYLLTRQMEDDGSIEGWQRAAD